MKLIDSPQMRTMFNYWKESRFASIGFVGTPQGLTRGQRAAINDIFREARSLVGVYQVHHCSRRGADEEAHYIAAEHKAVLVIHPHANSLYSVKLSAHQRRPTWPSFLAARDLVNEVSLLLVAPAFGPENDNVHNWDVVEQARKKPIAVLTIIPEVVLYGKN